MQTYRIIVVDRATITPKLAVFRCDSCQDYLAANFPSSDYLHNPDLSAVTSYPKRHWKIVDDTVVLQTAEEQLASDLAEIEVVRQRYNADLWQAAWDVNFGQISGPAVNLVDRLYNVQAPKGTAVHLWILELWSEYYDRKAWLYEQTLDVHVTFDATVEAIGQLNTDFTAFIPMPHSVSELMAEGHEFGVL